MYGDNGDLEEPRLITYSISSRLFGVLNLAL
jgi:hypothetical protein